MWGSQCVFTASIFSETVDGILNNLKSCSLITRESLSMRESVETRMTHHYCKHTETRPIRPAGCPGFLLYPHHCLRPEGTWAGSHNFSLGCPGCPSCLTSESWGSRGWRWVAENFPRPTDGWVIKQHPCLLLHSLNQNRGDVCYPMNFINGGPTAATVLKIAWKVVISRQEKGCRRSLRAMSSFAVVVLDSETSLLLKIIKMSLPQR